MEEAPADESLKTPTAQPRNLRGSDMATLGRRFPRRAVEDKPKISPDSGYMTTKFPPPVETLQREAGICRSTTASKPAAVLAYEKAYRLCLDHLRS